MTCHLCQEAATMASNESMKQSIDGTNSTQWAIRSLHSEGGGEGGGVSVTEFELVNLHTNRAHSLALTAAGATLGLLPISLSTTPSNYAYFTTPVPVNFMDFDHKGAVVGNVSVLLYSGSRLTIWDGSAYVGQRLVDKLTIDGGWGVSTPGADVGWGVTQLIFGKGIPSGDVELTAPNIDIPY